MEIKDNGRNYKGSNQVKENSGLNFKTLFYIFSIILLLDIEVTYKFSSKYFKRITTKLFCGIK